MKLAYFCFVFALTSLLLPTLLFAGDDEAKKKGMVQTQYREHHFESVYLLGVNGERIGLATIRFTSNPNMVQLIREVPGEDPVTELIHISTPDRQDDLIDRMLAILSEAETVASLPRRNIGPIRDAIISVDSQLVAVEALYQEMLDNAAPAETDEDVLASVFGNGGSTGATSGQDYVTLRGHLATINRSSRAMFSLESLIRNVARERVGAALTWSIAHLNNRGNSRTDKQSSALEALRQIQSQMTEEISFTPGAEDQDRTEAVRVHPLVLELQDTGRRTTGDERTFRVFTISSIRCRTLAGANGLAFSQELSVLPGQFSATRDVEAEGDRDEQFMVVVRSEVSERGDSGTAVDAVLGTAYPRDHIFIPGEGVGQDDEGYVPVVFRQRRVRAFSRAMERQAKREILKNQQVYRNVTLYVRPMELIAMLDLQRTQQAVEVHPPVGQLEEATLKAPSWVTPTNVEIHATSENVLTLWPVAIIDSPYLSLSGALTRPLTNQELQGGQAIHFTQQELDEAREKMRQARESNKHPVGWAQFHMSWVKGGTEKQPDETGGFRRWRFVVREGENTPCFEYLSRWTCGRAGCTMDPAANNAPPRMTPKPDTSQ